MTRGQVGRELALVELTVAVAAVVATGLLFIVAPASHQPMVSTGWTDVPLATGAVGLVVGFAWMIRIYRANPEPDAHIWRYRRRDRRRPSPLSSGRR